MALFGGGRSTPIDRMPCKDLVGVYRWSHSRRYRALALAELRKRCGWAPEPEPQPITVHAPPLDPEIVEGVKTIEETYESLIDNAEAIRRLILNEQRLRVAELDGAGSSIDVANAYVYRGGVVPVVPGSQTANPTVIGTAVGAPWTGGGIAWINPNNAMVEDAVVATSTTPLGAVTAPIVGSAFGFTIPVGATIDGVVLRDKHHLTAGIGSSDNCIALYDGLAWSADNSVPNTWTPVPLAWFTTGGVADLWGLLTLTPAVVNAAAFAVGIQVLQGGGPVPTVQALDCIELTVHYS